MMLYLLWLAFGSLRSLAGADRAQRDAVAYVGYLFNMSSGEHCSKMTLPHWLLCQGTFIVGLPLDSHLGGKFLFSFDQNITHSIAVRLCHPWWRRLSKQERTQMFVSGMKIRRSDFLSMNVSGQVRFIGEVKRMMSIAESQNVVVISSELISSTILYVTKTPSNVKEDYLSVIWNVGEDSISNVSLKSLQILENRFASDILNIDNVPIQQWFVGFIRRQHRLHFRRSATNPELINVIEGSGYMQNEKANQFIKRIQVQRDSSNSSSFNQTLPSSWPVIVAPLLPIKMNALQIMNYVIPDNTFEDKTFKGALKINVLFSNNDSAVSGDPTRWISFNHKDQNIRINPKLVNIGETVLKVCAHNFVDNFICDKLTISVSSPPPQHHQIYVSKSHKDYIIRYTIPVAWFKRFGVKSRSEIFVEKASGNSPFDWDSQGNLEILDIASLEGKLIELMLKVLIKNESQIAIHLTLPVVAINRQRVVSGPLYRSQVSFRPDNQSEKKNHFLIRDMWEMLKQLAEYVGKFLDDSSIKVQIFSPLKSPMYFDKVQGQRDELVIFDWFFLSDSDHDKKLCSNSRLDKVDQELLFRSFSSFIMVNVTVLENRFGWVCPFVASKDDVVTSPATVSTQEMAIRTPTAIDTRLIGEEQILRRIFPNLQYNNFTVTAGLPFKSYVFRKNHFDKKNVKGMRLEFVSPSSDPEPWIALSSNNEFLFGLPLRRHVRDSPYKMRFMVTLLQSGIEHRIPFLVNVVVFDQKHNHQVRLAIDVEKRMRVDMDYRWRLVTEMDKYLREKCEVVNDCGKDLVLLDLEVATSTINSSHSRVTVAISFLSLLAMNDRYCPKLSLIRLHDRVLNTASSSISHRKPNFALKYLFTQCQLGEVAECDIILSGPCQGIELQPPDLGQITVYATVPFQQSLHQLCVFYNSTVWFTIVSEGSGTSNGGLYHDWISVNEESTSLVGLAMQGHIKADPYLLELIVHSNTVRQIVSPRIAVTVRSLAEHPLYSPFIHQPNHQIVVAMESIPRLTLDKNYLLFRFLFAKLTDQFFRSQCIKNGYIAPITPILPCGSNLVFQSILKSETSEIVTFKFSIISELVNTAQQPHQNPSATSLNGFDKLCPIDKLLKVQRALLGDNGSWNRPAVLPIVINYYYKANLGKVKDIKFEFLSACSKYQYSGKSLPENDNQGQLKSSQSQPQNLGEDRHMFLMATIVPTCSFIIISLCVGLLVACCLQRRNQKFQSSFNNGRLSVEFSIRGGTSPVILAGEYPHSYMPPSRPLILPNEKPPVAPPDYIAENNSLIITDEET